MNALVILALILSTFRVSVTFVSTNPWPSPIRRIEPSQTPSAMRTPNPSWRGFARRVPRAGEIPAGITVWRIEEVSLIS